MPPHGEPTRNSRTAGHMLVSDPTEAIRVWQQLITITCRANEHDSLDAYKNHGCRCPGAGRDAARYEKRRRASRRPRLIAAEPSARLLQALAAIGWSRTELAGRLQMNAVSVSSIQRNAQEQVSAATSRNILAVYRELKATPGGSARTAAFARRQGWPPPRFGGEVRRAPTEQASA